MRRCIVRLAGAWLVFRVCLCYHIETPMRWTALEKVFENGELNIHEKAMIRKSMLGYGQ